MRLLAQRWRLRTLMIVVAVVAAGLGGWRTVERRRTEFQSRASSHSTNAWEHRGSGSNTLCPNDSCREYQSEGYPPEPGGWHHHPIGGLMTRAERACHDYEESLASKYFDAASYPWLPVSDDPPAPDLPHRCGLDRNRPTSRIGPAR